jgi:hypothetical protein
VADELIQPDLTFLLDKWLQRMQLEGWKIDVSPPSAMMIYKSYPYIAIKDDAVRVYNSTWYFDYSEELNCIRDPNKPQHLDIKAADPEFFNKLYVECRRRMKIEWKRAGGPSRDVLAERWLTFNPELDD